MLYWATVLFVLALIAAIFAYGGIAKGSVAVVAGMVFGGLLVLALMALWFWWRGS